jgi:hypothetical protein
LQSGCNLHVAIMMFLNGIRNTACKYHATNKETTISSC